MGFGNAFGLSSKIKTGHKSPELSKRLPPHAEEFRQVGFLHGERPNDDHIYCRTIVRLKHFCLAAEYLPEITIANQTPMPIGAQNAERTTNSPFIQTTILIMVPGITLIGAGTATARCSFPMTPFSPQGLLSLYLSLA